jgi:hypothetical protein
MTLSGPFIPIRVEPSRLPDPGPLVQPEPPDREPGPAVDPIREPAREPEPVRAAARGPVPLPGRARR